MKIENRRTFMLGMAAAATAIPWSFNALAQGNLNAMSSWERIASSKILRIGAVAGSEPNYRKDLATGEWSGIMIDFAKNLAAKLNVALVVTETTWGNSILDLQSNKIDLFFGLNPTPQRLAVLDFSEPLFFNAFSLIVRKGFNVKTWDELNKPTVTIAVDMGSSYDNLVTTMYDKAKILRFEKSNDATLAVQTGRADVQPLVVTLSPGLLKKNPNVGHLVVPEPIKSTSTNIGFRKEQDKALRDYVNHWIAELRNTNAVTPIILGNLEKLMGIKRSEIPALVNF